MTSRRTRTSRLVVLKRLLWRLDFEQQVVHVGRLDAVEDDRHRRRRRVDVIERAVDVVVEVIVLHQPDAVERNDAIQLELLPSIKQQRDVT